MSYFKTSFATLQEIARSGRSEDVAGFLVLARHASGLPHAGYEPYKLSGAGINSIHEKAGLSEETARGVVERLKEHGVIRAVSAETKKAFFHARWEIVQGELDCDLPHALTDAFDGGATDSALRRLRKHRPVSPSYAQMLTDVSDTELRLDALMTLLALYRRTSMHTFGGISPRCIFRQWDLKSQTAKLGSIRWGAEPDRQSAYPWFMAECLNQQPAGKKGELTDAQISRFWNAWEVIKATGLVYEAVALFDVSPSNNDKAQLVCTLRVNDYHAGSTIKSGDPSLLRELEDLSGSRFAYYTPAVNDRGEPEAMWVLLPDKRGALVGVWRPRFRARNQDAGAWIDHEKEAIDKIVSTLEANDLRATGL